MITVTPKAAEQIFKFLEENKLDPEKNSLRIYVQGGGCGGLQYGLTFDPLSVAGDRKYKSNGINVVVDPISYSYVNGAEIDYDENSTISGFKINNPNATTTCGCGQSFST